MTNETTTAPELRDYQIAKRDALAYIAELGITAEIKPNGVHETPAEGKDGSPWLHFRWDCIASRPKPGEAYKGAAYQSRFDDYKTGIGNSTFKLNPNIRSIDYGLAIENAAKRGDIYNLSRQDHRLTACRHLAPKVSDIADILGSYARDYADANNAGSFEDWASEYGMDTDSRKAEEIYRACLAQRKPLIALGLSMAQIEKIAEYASQF